MNERACDEKSLVKLAKLIHLAFVELRLLGGNPQHDRIAALADVFHNLPLDMVGEQNGLNVEYQRTLLQRYQDQYRTNETSGRDHVRALDYVGYFNEIFPP